MRAGRDSDTAKSGPLGRLRRAALDLLLPPRCLGCGAVTASAGLCRTCWPEADFIGKPFCPVSGIPFEFDAGPGARHPSVLAEEAIWTRARAALRFNDLSRSLVHKLKYADRMEAAPVLARWMARAGAELLDETDVLVPVPLHSGRLWQRRFNQAGELAKHLSAITGRPVMHGALRRVKATPSQVGLSPAQRKRNMIGAFEVPDAARGRLSGRALLLIDDVFTTGATVASCAARLKRAGAARVDVLTVARVVPEEESPL